jgi:acetyltransferase
VNEAELTALTADEYQGRGLGSELSRRLLEIARAEKLDRVTVEIPEGNPLLDVCGGLGFALRPASGGIVCGSLEL